MSPQKIVFTLGLLTLAAVFYLLFFEKPALEKTVGNEAKVSKKIRTPWPMYRKDQKLSGHVKNIPAKLKRGWTFQASAAFRAGVVLSANELFCVDGKGKLYCLSRSDGKKLWELNLGSRVTAEPLLLSKTSDSKLFVATNSGRYFCVNAISGKVRWQKDFEDKISGGSSFYQKEDVTCLLLPCHDGFLYSLSAADGSIIWKVDAKEPINATPAVAKEQIIFGCCDGKLRFVSIDGKATRRVDLGSYLPSSPAVEGDVVYTATHSGHIHAVGIESGEKLWSFSHSDVEDFFGPPVISQKYVAAVDKRGNLFIVEKESGKLARIITLPGDMASEPLVDKESIVLGDKDGQLASYSLATAKKAWQISVGSSILAPLTLGDDELYVADKDGLLTQYIGDKSE